MNERALHVSEELNLCTEHAIYTVQISSYSIGSGVIIGTLGWIIHCLEVSIVIHNNYTIFYSI